MEHTVIGVFDDIGQAQSAEKDLVTAGFTRARIHVQGHAEGTASSTEASSDTNKDSIGHFFKSLFGLEHESAHRTEHDIYAEALRRGYSMVSVETKDEIERDRAVEVLQRHDPIDLDQRVQQWRSAGWRGYDPKAPRFTQEQIKSERSRFATQRDSSGQRPSSGDRAASGQRDATSLRDSASLNGSSGHRDSIAQRDLTGQRDASEQRASSSQRDASAQRTSSSANEASNPRDTNAQRASASSNDASRQRDASAQRTSAGTSEATGQRASANSSDASSTRTSTAQVGSIGQRSSGGEHATTKVPVVEEQLKVGKRTIEQGGVRVFRRTIETPVHESVELRREKVQVQRHAVDKPASEADMAAFEEGSFEISATSEEPVVSKQARVVEEIEIDKTVEHEKVDIDDTVRRTEVDVQRMQGDGAGTTASAKNADDVDYRRHWQSVYGSAGGEYDEYDAAYRYGSSMGSSGRFKNSRWEDAEPQMRRQWEADHPESAWDRVKDAVRYGADRISGKGESSSRH